MALSDTAAVNSADLELVITRVFDAPRSVVFKAWTEPEHLVRWWGPRGFTLPSCKMDLRPGGAYRFHMRGPEGDEHWSQGVFREIVEPERLAMAGSWADAQGNPTTPETLLSITFEEQGQKTKLTLRQSVFESVTARDAHRGGWTSSFERLADYVTAL
ncbi:MAG TPA: SRPBCC domain-containing protein [Candidatus Binataceae bacterium]|nr:SRPBCC domain-containing protein [Candidatus Binataceae bacterium]